MYNPVPLAIVVPAYKSRYLQSTLQSIAAQKDERFRLYVCDDAGPEAIARTCAEYAASGKDIAYHRFQQNLGGRALPVHWNRCIALTSEPWVWLFSDDDVMMPDCVSAFYEELDSAGDVDVLRFNTNVIDAQGRLSSKNPPHPRDETGADFIYHRLLGQRQSYVVDYIFRREVFDAVAGFPDYPLAWAADYAAWFLFSRRGGIRTMPAGAVHYRAHGDSISGARRRYQPQKFAATLRFLEFVEADVAATDSAQRSQADWQTATENWFRGMVHDLLPVGPALWARMYQASRRWWRRPALVRLVVLALLNTQAWMQHAVGKVRRRKSE